MRLRPVGYVKLQPVCSPLRARALFFLSLVVKVVRVCQLSCTSGRAVVRVYAVDRLRKVSENYRLVVRPPHPCLHRQGGRTTHRFFGSAGRNCHVPPVLGCVSPSWLFFQSNHSLYGFAKFKMRHQKLYTTEKLLYFSLKIQIAAS